MKNLRAFATSPITEWAQAILNLAIAIVAILTLLMNLPVLPPEIVAALVSIVAVLNTIIQFLKLLIPA